MRILITGSRDWDCDALALRVLSGIKAVRESNGRREPIIVVDGACHIGKEGVDGAFHRAARSLGMETERWPAKTFGDWPGCGPDRNSFMVSRGADLCVACHPDLKASKGTLDCVRKMLAAGMEVVLHRTEDDPGILLTQEACRDLCKPKS